MLDALGIRKRSTHDFRRTFSTLAEDAGVATTVVDRMLHPSPTDVPSRYRRVLMPRMHRELARLPIVYRGPTARPETPDASSPQLSLQF